MTLVSTGGYTQELSLMCSTPIFAAGDTNTNETSKDRKRCEKIRAKFNQYLSKNSIQGFLQQPDVVNQDESIKMIVSRSMAGVKPIDVWIGGAEYLHEIAINKELVAETNQISRDEWTGGTISVSITRSTNNYQLSYMFMSWMRNDADISDLIAVP